MTLQQLNNLDELELQLILYVVNVVDPMTFPKIDFSPRNLTFFRHEFLVKKLVNAFPNVLPEGHVAYASLLSKLGYTLEIPKPTEEPTGSI